MDLTFTVAGGIAENHRQGDPPPFHEEIRRNQLAEVNHEQRAFLPLLPLSPFFPLSSPCPFPPPIRVYQYVRPIYPQRSLSRGAVRLH